MDMTSQLSVKNEDFLTIPPLESDQSSNEQLQIQSTSHIQSNSQLQPNLNNTTFVMQQNDSDISKSRNFGSQINLDSPPVLWKSKSLNEGSSIRFQQKLIEEISCFPQENNQW